MMRWIVGASMQLRVLVVVIAALIMVFGVSQLRQMPVDVLPAEGFLEVALGDEQSSWPIENA